MLFNLLGTFVAGIGAAGMIILAYKYILRIPRPKAAIPAAAGVVMILFQVFLDYGWFSRATADFEGDLVVVSTFEGKSLLQPLSYVIARTDRFIALEAATLKEHDKLPGVKLGTLHIIARDAPNGKRDQLFDCINNKRADVTPDLSLTATDLQTKTKWLDMPQGWHEAACK
ncbi:MAG: hypothetical protein OIF56_14765 [Cohaesibacter sp.]|nr:hypothetical protein [Cohaesibacter sp.]MCV6601191.1 hypothetical protein [Cohaesibacter sp.]